jgi:hypothetical protein
VYPCLHERHAPSLDDIIASKKAAGRSRQGRASDPGKNPEVHWEALAVARKGKYSTAAGRQREKALAALKAESERQLEELIRRRLPGGGSTL